MTTATEDYVDTATEDVLESTGKAMGFMLAAVLRQTGDLQSSIPNALEFIDALGVLTESERFSPNVSIVMNGIIAGFLAYGAAGKLLEADSEII